MKCPGRGGGKSLSTSYGRGPALQRGEGELPVLVEHDEFAVEDQAGRQLAGRGDEVGEAGLQHRAVPRLHQHPLARSVRGEQDGPVPFELHLGGRASRVCAGDGVAGLGQHRLQRRSQRHIRCPDGRPSSRPTHHLDNRPGVEGIGGP